MYKTPGRNLGQLRPATFVAEKRVGAACVLTPRESLFKDFI
jgi:hypothetical protein